MYFLVIVSVIVILGIFFSLMFDNPWDPQILFMCFMIAFIIVIGTILFLDYISLFLFG